LSINNQCGLGTVCGAKQSIALEDMGSEVQNTSSPSWSIGEEFVPAKWAYLVEGSEAAKALLFCGPGTWTCTHVRIQGGTCFAVLVLWMCAADVRSIKKLPSSWFDCGVKHAL